MKLFTRIVLSLSFATVLSLSFAVMSQAHSLWINSFESHAHKPGHAMVSLGWGHALPMDDVLNAANGKIAIDSFNLYDPSLKIVSLYKPPFKSKEPDMSNSDFDIYSADLGAQKIVLKKGAAKGVYQLSVISKPTFYTQYIDKKDRQHLKLKPKNEIQDTKTIINSVRYQAFAKSYLTVGKWQEPKPLGHALEIIPKTDLSNLKAGDLVEVYVTFYGKPLTSSIKGVEYITAWSSSFGQSDNFSLYSHLMGGRAQFRVQSSGQWIITIYHKQEVTKNGDLKKLYGKTDEVYHGATLTFNVK